jgi:hypothetical protein
MMAFGFFLIKNAAVYTLYSVLVAFYMAFRWWPYFIDYVAHEYMWIFYPLSAAGIISLLLLLRIIDSSLRSRSSIAP